MNFPGMSLTGNRMHRPSLQGSVFWMAPEVVKQSGHTRKADIWSVGCLVVEMLTGEHPWATLTQMQAIFKVRSSPLVLSLLADPSRRSGHPQNQRFHRTFRATRRTFYFSRLSSTRRHDHRRRSCCSTRG
jgi:serine/threonine protein kinase